MFADAPDRFRDRPPRFAEAGELVSVGLDRHGREALLAPGAAAAWLAMARAATIDGRTLLLVSAYRSITRQAEIVRRKRARGDSWDAILRVNAYPGFSEHHTGCAVDLGAPGCVDLTEAFEATAEFAWLSTHAGRFGFRLSYPRDNTEGITYEPWHWRWHDARAG
ncbi:MAG: D-alanyl-D-alanine carboxypeptidase family protein [Opitutaceae bacterium]|nr:D-alanyl-D-alanine carboxypeptidase family protein [Opitutaceae bacterium]